MARLAAVLAHQKRFVRDTSHQLRTPLAVLKAQVQSALRGDVAAPVALTEIAVVERATELANQMLALAEVKQLRQQGDAPIVRWDDSVRSVALDVAPLAVRLAVRRQRCGIDGCRPRPRPRCRTTRPAVPAVRAGAAPGRRARGGGADGRQRPGPGHLR